MSDDKSTQLLGNETDRLVQQDRVISFMDPAAGARRVWKWDDGGPAAHVCHDVTRSNQLGEREARKKTLDGEPPYRDQHLWPDDSELLVQPVGAARLLHSSGDAIPSSARMGSGVAAGHRRDVDGLSRGGLIQPGLVKPTKEGPSCSAGERAPAFCLNFAWSLTHEHGPRVHSSGYYGTDVSAELAPLTCAERG
jgi:hypothetical protein